MSIPRIFRTIFLLFLLLLSIAVAYYFFFARENFYAVVNDHVYRSAQLDGEALSNVVERYGIRSIINLRGKQPEKLWYREESATAKKYHVKLYDIDFSAMGLPPITDLLKLKQLLQEADQPILVHCRGGADRTGMASALVLLLDGRTTLEEAQQQLSVKYFNFMPQSIGKLLLGQYKVWLEKTGATHSTEIFTNWLEDGYMDANGNLRFYVDQINGVIWRSGTRYEDGYKYIVDRDTNPELEVSGWAFDIKNRRLVKNVSVYLDKKHLGKAEYGFAYEGVARYFGDNRYMDSGWMLRTPVTELEQGCYDLSLEIVRLDSTVWHSPPQARVCLR